ncbi:type II secretion system F family protein [Rhodocaloribacter litoris]|uniref:type II secretion system F family protein n=1 Tax=Rhodocaloribacter litoris TaxID=2558931 RepID=UPI00141FC8C9|nr:type II secretion system F family protein [Rhodocaloribacter litoris]QXD15234.1 type II secretion system F family protein [Rhodocaloribacter litoris]
MAAVREYKFVGISHAGQPVQGTVFAPSRRAAQKKVQTLAEKHGFRPRDVQQRQVYLYKVRHPNGKVVTGEQKAFSAQEIETALRKMGLEVLKVEKKLLNFQRKPPRQDMIMFVRLAANLLKEKLPFDEVLNLLVNDVSSRSLKQVIRDLNADLKGGMEAQQAFMKHQHMLGKFTAYMLGIASRSGNMAEIYESTARFLERQNEFKKSVRSAMVTPTITILVLIAAFIWYVWYIFPQTAGLFSNFGIELPPMTAATLRFSEWMDRNYLWLILLFSGTFGGFLAFARTPKGRFHLHRLLIRIPGIGELLHKLNIEIFCRVFGVLYSGSGDNINVIKIAAEACGNAYMEHRIKTITVPMMVAQGADLVRSMEASGVFTQMALARFRSGAETGNVRASALQMADYYEKETTLKLRSTVETIQTVVAIIITIAIMFLTIISSEIALIQPSSTDIMRLKK